MAIVFVRPAETGRNSKYCFFDKNRDVWMGWNRPTGEEEAGDEQHEETGLDGLVNQPRWSQVVQDGWNIHHLYHSTTHNPCAKLAHCVGMYELMSPELYLGHPWPSVLTATDMSKVLDASFCIILIYFDLYKFAAFLSAFFERLWCTFLCLVGPPIGRKSSLKKGKAGAWWWKTSVEIERSTPAFTAFWAWWGSLHLWPFAWKMSDKIW